MSRYPNYMVVLLAGFASSLIVGVQSEFANAQDAAAFRKPLQSREEVAALPPSTNFGAQSRTAVRAGFAPQANGQAANNQARANRQPTQADVYPYPASNQPRGTGYQSNNSLSRNNANARFADRSFGGNVSTGNLGNANFAQQNQAARAQQAANNDRQSSGQVQNNQSNLNQPNATRQNPGWTNPARTNPARTSSRSNAATANTSSGANRGAAFILNRNSAPRVSSRAPVEQQRSSTINRTAERNTQSGANQTGATTAFRQAAYQAPSLRTAQNCNCAPNYQVPNGYAAAQYNPTSAGYQAAFQAPALNPAVGSGLVAPGQNPQYQPGFQQQCLPQPGQGFQFQPGVGTPQFGAQGARWWTPFVTGSGVYTPLIRLANVKPGTYLGQGIIGQPTAYVDGQPVRNLLRYVAP
ncbi:MAG: hypothetical protein AB8B55_00435 [Mariniblastus sp.]